MTLGNVQDIVLVLSGKGGVGKSSTTTQLALSLCLLGKTVGILDVDLTGPSMARFLNVESEKITQAPGGWLPVKVHDTQNLPSHTDTSPPRPAKAANETSAVPAVAVPLAVTHPEQKVGALYAMSLAFLLSSRDSAVVWRGPKKTAMVRQFISDVLWPELDYLLVDTPPGTSDEHISLVESLLKAVVPALPQPTSNGESANSHPQPGPRLAGAVLVTTPQAISTADVRKELSFCHKTAVPVIGVIENMSGFVCPCCGEISNIFSKGGGQIMAMDWNVPFLGTLAVDEKWGLLIEEGRRPTYDVETNNASLEDNLDQLDLEDEVKVEVSEEDKNALLVDKYRSCSLRTVFSDIAKQVVDTVDRRAAVQVVPPPSAMGR